MINSDLVSCMIQRATFSTLRKTKTTQRVDTFTRIAFADSVAASIAEEIGTKASSRPARGAARAP